MDGKYNKTKDGKETWRDEVDELGTGNRFAALDSGAEVRTEKYDGGQKRKKRRRRRRLQSVEPELGVEADQEAVACEDGGSLPSTSRLSASVLRAALYKEWECEEGSSSSNESGDFDLVGGIRRFVEKWEGRCNLRAGVDAHEDMRRGFGHVKEGLYDLDDRLGHLRLTKFKFSELRRAYVEKCVELEGRREEMRTVELRLKQQVEAFDKEGAAVRKELRVLQLHTEGLRTEVKERDGKIEDLGGQLQESLGQLEEITVRESGLRLQLAEMGERAIDAEGREIANKRRSEEQERLVVEASVREECLKRQVEEMTGQWKESLVQLEEITAKESDLRLQLVEAGKRIADAEGREIALMRRFEEQERSIEEAGMRVEGLERQIEEMRGQLMELSGQLEKTTMRESGLQRQLVGMEERAVDAEEREVALRRRLEEQERLAVEVGAREESLVRRVEEMELQVIDRKRVDSSRDGDLRVGSGVVDRASLRVGASLPEYASMDVSEGPVGNVARSAVEEFARARVVDYEAEISRQIEVLENLQGEIRRFNARHLDGSCARDVGVQGCEGPKLEADSGLVATCSESGSPPKKGSVLRRESGRSEGEEHASWTLAGAKKGKKRSTGVAYSACVVDGAAAREGRVERCWSSGGTSGTSREERKTEDKRMKGFPWRRPPRTAVVAVRGMNSGFSYRDALQRAREHISLTELGIKESRIRKAANGGILIEIPGESSVRTEQAGALAAKLGEILKDEAAVSRPTMKGELRVIGFDDSIVREEIVRSLVESEGCSVDQVVVGPIREVARGCCSAWVQCPLVAAHKLARRGKIRIGWSTARVEPLKARPLQCFKCWEFGHVRGSCTSEVERGSACFRCGENGHSARSCSAEARCVVCVKHGRRGNHRMGSDVCGSVPGGSWQRKRGLEEPGRRVGCAQQPSGRDDGGATSISLGASCFLAGLPPDVMPHSSGGRSGIAKGWVHEGSFSG